MKKLTLAAAAALLSLNALAQDPLQCVNPDVLTSLVFSARSETQMRVTESLPEEMSEYRAPDGFELIGTAVRGDGNSTTVAFKTALASEVAFAALLASLEPDGWEIEAERSPAQTFNVTSQPVTGTVCRNSERRSLSVQDSDGVRYANINSFPDTRQLACHAEDPRLALRGPGMFDAMRASMPQLDFPPTARPADGRGGLGGGISGSGETISTSSRIASPDTAASLSEHLAPQMIAQGWSRDAAWTGTLSSGSTWTRQGADGRNQWGTIEIVGFGDDIYEVGLMLVTEPL